MNTKKGTSRTRNYATIVYPDSAPEDWMEKLSAMHIPAFISPLHDKDINPDGTKKKSHWHVLIMFGSVKTKKQAEDLVNEIGGVGVEVVNCLSAYARYLVHMDDDKKVQYNAEEVVAMAGANYDAVTFIPTDELSIVSEIINFINVNQINSFARLVNICKKNNPEWLRIIALKKTSYFFFQYIKSRTWDSGIEVKGDIESESYSE